MFLNTFHPSPILIDFGPFQIHWYGFLIASAVLIGLLIARKLFKQYNLNDPRTAVLWDDYHKNISATYTAGWGVIPMPNVQKCLSKIGQVKYDLGITQSQIDDFSQKKYTNWSIL